MLPHRIRLRGPWQFNSTPPSEGAARERIVRLPDEWHQIQHLVDQVAIRMTRRFGWPANLETHERVWLTLDHLLGPCTVCLNNVALGVTPAAREWVEFEITHCLSDRNELHLDFASPRGHRLWDEIAVEVRGAAWLDDLSAEKKSDTVVVRGRVKGRAESPLDLYAILGRSPVIHATVDASESGREFEIASALVPPDRWAAEVRVELVCGSAVWHSAVLPLIGE